MLSWLESLSGLQRFLYIVAISSTIILFLQSLLSILGLDNDMNDVDSGFLEDFAEADFQFFSIRGIIAFFSLFGWTGALLSDTALPTIIVLFIAILAGLAGMFTIAYLFHSMTKLQHNGTLNYENAMGKTAEVYIPIPPNKEGKGKITFQLQGRFIEADALTTEKTLLGTGTVVTITEVINETIFVVNKYKEE